MKRKYTTIVLLGLLGAGGAYVFLNRKKEETPNPIVDTVTGAFSTFGDWTSDLGGSGLSWLQSAGSNFGGWLGGVSDSVQENATEAVDDAGSFLGNAASNVWGGATSIWDNATDLWPFGFGNNLDSNTDDLSQFGTADNPTGYFVLSEENQDIIDGQNGGGSSDNEPGFFQRATGWFSNLWNRDSGNT